MMANVMPASTRAKRMRRSKMTDARGHSLAHEDEGGDGSCTCKRCATCASLASRLLLATPAAAQDYPTKPVTIIIPFAAGGAGDILARILSPRLEKAFGKPFVVENKPGAGGVIGAVATARAEPDGHTIMIAPSPTMAVNVTLFKKLPYDPAADFVPLAMAAQTPFVLVVNPALPIKSVADLIKWVKEQKGKVSYATAGPGVPHHLFAELLKSMTGIEMSPVPYKGSVPAITDVVAGHVPLMFVDLGPGAVDHPGRQGARDRRLHGGARARHSRCAADQRHGARASTWRPGRWWSRRRRRRARSSTGCMRS